MSAKIKPRGKYILVRPEEEKNRENEFGIITPTNVEQERKSFGEVIAVGPDIMDVKKGQRVVFGTFAGDTVQLTEKGKDVDYKLLHDDDVIAFIED